MTHPVQLAVIGLGAMGKNHVRVAAELQGFALCALVDADKKTRENFGRIYNVPNFETVAQMLHEVKVEAAIVAVPTALHLSVGCELIGAGVHVFLEKPIALTPDHGERLIVAAVAAKVKLTVGHIERFNPAVLELRKRVLEGELGRVLHIEARRQGPFPSRIQDVGVIVDLAVHDIDLVRFVSGCDVIRVYAETNQRVHQHHEDLVRATLRLSDGAVCSLSIDWLTPTKVRELSVTGERGMFVVNLLTQDLTYFENGSTTDERSDEFAILRGVSEGRMIRYVIHKREPLRAELEAFRDALSGDHPIAVSGEDGLQALRVANAMLASSKTNSVVNF
jgi:UDP-N-acetylglucosamine 3-dehydrogenase